MEGIWDPCDANMAVGRVRRGLRVRDGEVAPLHQNCEKEKKFNFGEAFTQAHPLPDRKREKVWCVLQASLILIQESVRRELLWVLPDLRVHVRCHEVGGKPCPLWQSVAVDVNIFHSNVHQTSRSCSTYSQNLIYCRLAIWQVGHIGDRGTS